jgi:hypothetical protein
MVYRSYRVPYRWVPQVERPAEQPVVRLSNSKFRVPGSTQRRTRKITRMKDARQVAFSPDLCILPREED